jgi:hypothetical protein
MMKKAATLVAAGAAMMLAAAPAYAGNGVNDNDDNHVNPQLGLANVSNVLNEVTVGVCDVTANVLGVQVDDSLNNVGLDAPVLSPGSPSFDDNDVPEVCAANTETDVDVDGH